MIERCLEILLFVVIFNKILLINGTTILDDDVHFDIQWLGTNVKDDLFSNVDQTNIIDMKTENNENYKCVIPELSSNEQKKKPLSDVYIPVSNLVEPIYTRKICSYRIESYWIYELCHGQYIRQYHETKQSGKRVIPQEYFLGYYKEKNQEKEYNEENGVKKLNLDWRTIDGKQVPAYSVRYTDGTICELIGNKPRETIVYYICDENGNENIITFEEVSSCTYELVVSTKSLCTHPVFYQEKIRNPQIQCYAVDESPRKPESLVEFEYEQREYLDYANRVTLTSPDGGLFIIKFKPGGSADDESQQQEEGRKFFDPVVNNNNQQQTTQKPLDANADRDVINSFISGSHCLNGGVGWWKYEICYGKHVIQYHEEDVNGPRTVITLGKWDREKHIDWLKQDSNKRKRPDKNMAINLYTDGDYCEQANKKRSVEVKFKCDRLNTKSHSVAIYMIEPSTCEYQLTVESPLLCQFLTTLDSNGLIPSSTNENDNNNKKNTP